LEINPEKRSIKRGLYSTRSLHIIALLVLALFMGVLLPGIVLPARFFTLQNLVSVLAWYGCGALLIREFATIWRKGWQPILLLGAVLGLIKTGVNADQLMKQPAGVLWTQGVSGWWTTTDWVWVLQNTVCFMFFGVAIPILMVKIIYPDRSDQVWLQPWQRWVVLGVLVIITAWEAIQSTRQTGYWVVAIGLIIGLLVMLVRQFTIPDGWYSKLVRFPSPLFLRAGTFLAAIIFFTMPAVGKWLGAAEFLILVMQIIVLTAVLGVMVWGSKPGSGFDLVNQFAMATGSSAFFILKAALLELNKTSVENPHGMGLVAVVAIFLLGWLARRVERQEWVGK
jgi:hypothetical protein